MHYSLYQHSKEVKIRQRGSLLSGELSDSVDLAESGGLEENEQMTLHRLRFPPPIEETVTDASDVFSIGFSRHEATRNNSVRAFGAQWLVSLPSHAAPPVLHV